MGTIQNSGRRNIFGDGYEKIYTADNGDKYVIRNSALTNNIGGGYRQEVVKISDGETTTSSSGGSRLSARELQEIMEYLESPKSTRRIAFTYILVILGIVGGMALLIGLIPLLGWLATL